MNFDLVTPCVDCPFRRDKLFYLRPSRVAEIAASCRRGEVFSCHKTVDYSGDEPHVGRKAQACAGALLILDKEDALANSQLIRIAGRLGVFDPDKLHGDVYDSFEDYMEALR